MAQQGSPPRRPSRQPDPEHARSGERPDRQDRPRQDRLRQDGPRRPERAGRQAYQPFGPEDEADLPPWVAPSSYRERPGGSRVRPSGQRDRVRDRYADPYAEPASTDRTAADGAARDGGYRGPARRDGAHSDGGYLNRAYEDVAHQDGGYENRGYHSRGFEDPASDGGRYEGRRRLPDAFEGDGEDTDAGGYKIAPAAVEPDAPAGRGASRRRGRAAAARLRKSRRRVYRWSGIAIVVVLLAAGGVWLFGRSTPAPAPWVTKLLAGEYKAVPNACTAVDASVLNAYLPASGRTERVSVGSSTDSQCGYTFDKQPTFLVLQISVEALQPFAAAGNNGSATANAQLNFVTARHALARPPRKSPLPRAMITPLARLGEQAIIGVQHEHVSGIGTDVVTVMIRERNVLLTVSVSGQESGHGFGPVPDGTLMACARAVAASVLAKAETEPTA
ncbi:MAG: hypothetical protein ACLQFR_15675 [Streptosporangiaceae bacterium]